MKVHQFRYSADNLAYVIHADGPAMAVDGGATAAILDFVRDNRLDLKWVANTHGHPDHTLGTRELADQAGAAVLDHRDLAEKGAFRLGSAEIRVIATPGHTLDSVCYYTGNALISGDTLFNGTVGNCFSGDLEAFFRSIKRLMALPEETVVYAGHDYVRESMIFAKRLEPDNPDINDFLRRYDPGHVRSTMAEEKRINPHLRFNDDRMIALLRRKGLAAETESDRWRSIMEVD